MAAEANAPAPTAETAPEPVSRPTPDPTPERLQRAHEALLHRFLGYIVGSLAGFLPLLEFAIASHEHGQLALPFVTSVFLAGVGVTVTIALSGAALVSLRQALNIESRLGLLPSQLGSEFRSASLTARVATRLTGGADATSWGGPDVAVDLAMFVVVLLMILIVAGLPW